MAKIKRPIEDRFWEKVDRTGECWVWTASTRGNYGQVSVDGRQRGAHRVAWFLAHGSWPTEDLAVCHSCDNPPCVRPDHLFLATQCENLQDMFRKGRNYMAHDRDGARNPNAKLSEGLVRAVLRDYAAGDRCIEIARRYNLDPSHCRKIVKRLIWKRTSIEAEVA